MRAHQSQISNSSRHGFAISPHSFRARFALTSHPPKRGRGECRAHGAPASLVCEGSGRMHTSSTGPPESPGIPARNGFTAYTALSPVNGRSCHRHPEKQASQELDASVAASGPHGFAVRDTPAPDLRRAWYRSAEAPAKAETAPFVRTLCDRSHRAPDAAASIASSPAFVTIAIRPSVGWTARL